LLLTANSRSNVTHWREYISKLLDSQSEERLKEVGWVGGWGAKNYLHTK